MGKSPIQIDIINQTNGIDFKGCFARRNIIIIQKHEILIISKNDLIQNKKFSGRHRDLADVESLEGK